MHHHDQDPAETRRLARLLSLEPDHPERVAFERDPRNRALRYACDAFAAGDDSTVPAGEIEHAEHELSAAFERALREDGTAARPHPVRGGMRPWRRLALAASVLLAVGAVWTMRPQTMETGSPSGVLRGEEAERSELHARWDSAGALHLDWPAETGASAYLVRIQGPALEEIATLRAEDSELEIDATRARTLAVMGATTWSVDAIVHGDERSLHRTAVLPPVP